LLYSNELDKWSKLGAVQIKIAFSRQSDENKKYVQHLIWEDRNEIAKLYHEGARFYTCGSAKKLAASVKACFIKIIADDQQCDEEKAAKILEKISIDRYNVDVFASKFIFFFQIKKFKNPSETSTIVNIYLYERQLFFVFF